MPQAYDPILPPASMFGLPERFAEWRPDQDRAALTVLDSTAPTIAAVAPTGFGKSQCAIAVAAMMKTTKPSSRAVYLTETKGLQRQLLGDFSAMGMVDIRGQGNYDCQKIYDDEQRTERCDSGPCHAGVDCDLKAAGCSYYDAFRKARWSDLVVTNYDYWLNINRGDREDGGLGKFDLLILDEAHAAPDKLCDFLSTTLTGEAVEGVLGARLLPRDAGLEAWGDWAVAHRKIAVARHDHLAGLAKAGHLAYDQRRDLKVLRGLVTALGSVVMAADDAANWVIDRSKGNDARFDPIWPAKYYSQLSQGVGKVLLLSATIRPKTLQLLGCPPGAEFLEYKSSFPVERRPVISVPVVQMRYGMSDDQEREWMRKVDQIIARRLDRKGIVHTVSYKRAKMLAEHSEYRHLMMLNEPKTTQTTVQRFKDADAPCVLVSPSVSTGFDFPYDECEYQVIVKVPFQSVKDSPALKARSEQDPDYLNYTAMQEVVQMAGRGMRAADDSCETIILDASWGNYFFRNNKRFAPAWFVEACRESSYVPAPLPKLERRLRDGHI